MKKGMTVSMSDGWRGRVESIGGGIIACIGEGERPDDHWCGNYRLVGPSTITIEGNAARVVWKPTIDREQRRAGIVADLIRSALEQSARRGGG
jgi:hypothetical protein